MAESARNCLNVVIHGLRKRLQQFDAVREYIIFKAVGSFILQVKKMAVRSFHREKAPRASQLKREEPRAREEGECFKGSNRGKSRVSGFPRLVSPELSDS
jgi:hypothetical protein